MRTELFKMDTYLEKAFCQECNMELQSAEYSLPTYPIKYVYFCPECKKEYRSTTRYPKVIYTQSKREDHADR